MDMTEIVTEVRSEIERIGAEAKGRGDKLQDQIDRILTALNRSRRGQHDQDEKGEATQEQKAFMRFLRHGRDALPAEEQKMLLSAPDPSGGYLAPSATMNEVIRVLRESSPLRRLARGVETGAGEIEVPRQTSSTTAGWVGEIEQRPETDMTFGGVSIPLHEIACFIDVSNKLLDDTAFKIEEFMYADFGETFAAVEAAAFLTGNGVKKPSGILQADDLVTVPSGSGSAVTGDGLISLVYKLKPSYRRNSSWLMNNNTAAAVRKLKSTDGNYLWNQERLIIAGQPETLLGYPVEIDDNMPDIASNALPILFGNWSRAYYIVNKPTGFTVLRDPYTRAGVGQVRFHARLRVGGALVRSEALAAQKVSS